MDKLPFGMCNIEQKSWSIFEKLTFPVDQLEKIRSQDCHL